MAAAASAYPFFFVTGNVLVELIGVPAVLAAIRMAGFDLARTAIVFALFLHMIDFHGMPPSLQPRATTRYSAYCFASACLNAKPAPGRDGSGCSRPSTGSGTPSNNKRSMRTWS